MSPFWSMVWFTAFAAFLGGILGYVISLCLTDEPKPTYDVTDDDKCHITMKAIDGNGRKVMCFRTDDGRCDNEPYATSTTRTYRAGKVPMTYRNEYIEHDSTSYVPDETFDRWHVGDAVIGREVKEAFGLHTRNDVTKDERSLARRTRLIRVLSTIICSIAIGGAFVLIATRVL